jgi:tRNA A-37 threonylcarbamoyl transferase component Bud32
MPELLTRLQTALAGRYRIEGEIGEGGMATVYLAHDLRHDRKVALKVLRPELAAVIGAERFLAEIKLTANLQHPHILPLFDSGEADGFLYYVMPFIEGESLRDRLRREKQLSIDDAVRVTREVASALDYAHRHGVIHRDVKPENILLHDGQALVADFGIALAASKAGSRMTETGMSLGTPHYMSPEQAMGEREITARSDVYALGCVLYEMLTGEPPFTGPTAQAVVAKVITERPADLIPRRETVPAHVEAAVLTALAKLPADRFATVAEFSAALLPGARTLPVRAARRTGGTRHLWAAALAGAALSAITAGVLAWRAGRQRGTGSSEGERAQHTFTGRAGLPALSPDGTFLAYIERSCRHGEDLCRFTLMVQEIGTNRPVPVLPAITRIEDVRWTRDGTSLVLTGDLGGAGVGLFVLPRLGGTPRRVADEGSFDTDMAGDSVVVLVPKRTPTTVRIVSLVTGGMGDSLVLPGVPRAYGLAWSPSGDRLAFASRPGLWLVDRRNGSILDSTRLNTRFRMRWTASGDAVLTFAPQRGREDHLMRIPADRRLGPPSIALPRIATLYQGMFDVARRTGRVAVATGDPIQDLWTFDLQGGHAIGRQVTWGTTWYGGQVLSPDGAFAYYLRGDAVGDNLYRLRLSDGMEEALTAERQTGADITTMPPGGREVFYGDALESGSEFELSRFELDSRRLTRRATGAVTTAWMLPGGRLIIQSRGGWSAADSFAVLTTARPLADSLKIVGLAVGPDSARIAALLERGDSSVLALVDLRNSATIPIPGVEAVAGTPENSMAWIGSDIYIARWR